MADKQIVTFELAPEHTPSELIAHLSLDHEKITGILNTYKQKLEEIIIIRTVKRIVFYTYTNDYSSLLTFFESHAIAPRHYTLLKSTKESQRHFSELIVGFKSNIKEEEQTLKCIKKAYQRAKAVESIGDTLDAFISNGITTHQLIHKESILGRISIILVSLIFNTFKKLFRKKPLPDISSSHEVED